MKVAIVHEWLVNFRGSERVLLELARLYPDAVIYASVVNRDNIPSELAQRDIRTTFIQKFPMAARLYQLYLPWMPRAYEQLDMSDYDLIISSSHACAKGIVPRPSSVHVCYCYTPMRYAWNGFHEYQQTLKLGIMRWMMARLMHRLRTWDVVAAARVDYFVACSTEIRRRIHKYYRRESCVIHPPVRFTEPNFHQVSNHVRELVRGFEGKPFLLSLGRLVRYKRVDLAVDACTRGNHPLVVAGDGSEYEDLRKRAGPTVHFVRSFSDADAAYLYEACRAFVFPGEEDFGITVVEAQAHGKPVVAYGKGGALDTVIPKATGLFFWEQCADQVLMAINELEQYEFDPQVIQTHASSFAAERFRMSIGSLIDDLLEKEQIEWEKPH